jgi:pilus assembly protein CpaC
LRRKPRLLFPFRVGLLVLLAGVPGVQFCWSQVAPPSQTTRELSVTVARSVMIDSAPVIQRVSVAVPEMADAIIVNPHEVLINGRAPGKTSLILWQEGGGRIFFNLTVRPDLEPTQQQLQENFPEGNVQLSFENNTWFLRGTVKQLVEAERAAAIAGTAGKVVNLIQVEAAAEPQIMLRVRFADVDRSAARDLGANLISAGALNTVASTTTGQFSPPTQPVLGSVANSPFQLSNLLNIFAFRPDLNLGVTIKALQSKSLLQILAEPNLVTLNNKEATFLAGGEFPFPVLQGGASVGAVSVQFREFGVRINFLPVITPRNTIRLRVKPEVSSLDFANALVLQGFTIPAISSRKLDTEVELADGQSFIIGGLLDHRVIDTFNKVPGLGDIPILKNLFRSRSQSKNNSELVVLVTAELVKPYAEGEAPPSPKLDAPFMEMPGQKPAVNPRVGGPSPAAGANR